MELETKMKVEEMELKLKRKTEELELEIKKKVEQEQKQKVEQEQKQKVEEMELETKMKVEEMELETKMKVEEMELEQKRKVELEQKREVELEQKLKFKQESKMSYFEKESNIEVKLIYKIISKEQENIIINNEVDVKLKKNDVFTIYYHNNYELFLNNKNIGTQNILEKIDYRNNNDYDLSIVIPFSLDTSSYESKINFNYILKEYFRITRDFPNIQLCLTQTEKEYSNLIDETIKENNINYIFVKNPYNINLGYTRNLWKYICNSNKIMFNDIDMPLSKKNLIELIQTSKKYDIVKPYDKNLIHTDEKEKDLYIRNEIIPNKKPLRLFSITGGITLFDKKVLLETGGYEEFNGHGYEDRCLDVIVLNNDYSIKKLNNKIVHLYHPATLISETDFDSINKKFYNCCTKGGCKDSIHEKCSHIKDTSAISRFNRKYNANLCLFTNPNLKSINLKNNIYVKELPDFNINDSLKDFTITLLGYTKIKEDGTRHTNWFPWNRFKDVYETIGYKCEWTSLEKLERNDEKRLFITWNEPTSLELYQSGKVNEKDIIFQKLTSLGKGMDDVNWTENPKKWCEEWEWPLYKNVENLYDKGVNIYGFGCKTEIDSFPEKKRICEKLKDRIHWITWGGTPFDWEQIKNCKPKMNNLNEDINFVGSKWGKVGRGNIDAWEKYIEPFESDTCKYKFNQYGGIGNKMVSDAEMVKLLQKSKLCPIIHAPSWQVERGVQDRFYTVFLSGRFGICDNLGAIDIFGDEIKDICTEDPDEYHKNSIYYLEHPDKQIKYIEIIQKKIKEEYNFYRQWERVLNSINFYKYEEMLLDRFITNKVVVYGIYHKPGTKNNHKYYSSIIYKNSNFTYINDKKFHYLKEIDLFKDHSTVVIDGITVSGLKNLMKIFIQKNINTISTVYLINNEDEDEYQKLYSNYNIPVFTDNFFTFIKLKSKIPIFLHLPLINKNIPIAYKKKKIFFSDRRTDIKKIKLIELIKKKHDFLNITSDNYEECFKKSSILLYIEDNFNIHRGSKKIIDAIMHNKFIILENKNNQCTLLLKHINYPNYLLFNKIDEINIILDKIKINEIKYFDSNILNNKFLIYNTQKNMLNYKKFIRMHSKTIIILGNGPSCKDLNFKKINFATIGMNVAFRHWYKINWFPDIYCCLDVELLTCHFSAISELIKNKKCQKFFLRKHFQSICKKNNIEILEENVYYLEDMEHILFESNKHITTGSYALRFALFLGYIDIRLIGIDSNYINYVENCEKKSNLIESTALEIKYDKPSVNYFFEDYQKKGDVYNVPNVDKGFKCECKYCNGNIMNHKDLHNKVFDFIIKDKEDIKEYQNVSIKIFSEISQLKQFKKEKIELIYN